MRDPTMSAASKAPMIAIDSPFRVRVNGSSLQEYHAKPVCLLGTVLKADGGGSAFQLKASDGATINIRLKSPISEPLTGLIEVYGIGQGRNLIIADSFTMLKETSVNAAGKETKFDMPMYNDALGLLKARDDNVWLPE